MQKKVSSITKKLLLSASIPLAVSASIFAISCKKTFNKISKETLLSGKLQSKLSVLEYKWDSIEDRNFKSNHEPKYRSLMKIARDAIASNKENEIKEATSLIDDFIRELFFTSEDKVDIKDYWRDMNLYWDSYERFIDLMQNQYISDSYTKVKQKYERQSLRYKDKDYNIYSDVSKLINILNKEDKKQVKVFALTLKNKVDVFEKELKDINDTSTYNNAPKLDESVPEEIHIDWNYDVIPKLKELVNKTWDKETFSKIHSFQTYGDVIRILGEDLSKHFNEIPKEYVKYWDFIDVDFLKNDLLQLQDRDKNQKVNLLNDKTINIRVFNSEVISLGFSRINTVIEVINHLFNTYILPEITTYHSELVIFNKLKKIIKEYEENYTSLKNIELKPNGTLSATKYAEPYRYKPDGAHIDEDLLQSHLNVSVGNNQIKLIYWAQKEGVDKPTKYKDKNGYIKYTNEKDITKEHFIEEILEIGYYKNKEGLVQSTKMPINIGKVPNKLPEVITSLEDMFKNWCYDPGVIYFNPNFWPKKLVGIEEWDTSNIVDLSGMFSHSYFNQDISKWNVENVINMSGLFLNSSFNQNISSWDVSNVTTMEGMFFRASSFNQPLNNWNVESVFNMKNMFNRAYKFNQPLDRWKPKSLETMESMFYRARSFNQDLSSWHLRKDVKRDYFNWYTNNWTKDKWPKFDLE